MGYHKSYCFSAKILQKIRSFARLTRSPRCIILELMTDAPTPDLEITPQTYLQLRDQGDAPLLLDVREPIEFQIASLPDALLMPMGEVTSRAHTELDPDRPIVVLCHHGQRSLSVTMWLRNQGFDYASPLAGGIDAWSRTIDPAIPPLLTWRLLPASKSKPRLLKPCATLSRISPKQALRKALQHRNNFIVAKAARVIGSGLGLYPLLRQPRQIGPAMLGEE